MKRKILTALLLATVPAFGPAMADPAPKLSITSFSHMPTVTLKPYDETANAKAAVDAAFARARQSHKRVLLDLGGNWCPDCIALANFMLLPEMKPFLAAHYEIALVDVGRFNRNLDIPARFGFTQRLTGVPMILVATPDGKLLNRGDVFALDSAASLTPKALAAYLARWTN
jgi:thiol-disulfide isomerase/thioredoxin